MTIQHYIITGPVTYQSLAQEALSRWGERIDQERLDKAILIASTPGCVEQSNPGLFDVRASNGYDWYEVDARRHSCDCSDHEFHPWLICKHRLAVWLYTEYLARRRAILK